MQRRARAGPSVRLLRRDGRAAPHALAGWRRVPGVRLRARGPGRRKWRRRAGHRRRGADRLNNRFGQVYAFSGATGAVLWLAKEGTQALASFGTSLASVADRNGDGRRDLLVGAIFHDTDSGSGTSLDGRAYLLSGATGAEIRHIENPLGAAGENFGLGLTPVGDQTGDGSEDDAISDPGAARVHLFNGATGAAVGTITTTGAATDNFGFDLAPSEDRDGDGKPDLWAGAPGAGRVDLVNASGSVLLMIADPTPGGPTPLGFGFAVAATPDLGGDAGS